MRKRVWLLVFPSITRHSIAIVPHEDESDEPEVELDEDGNPIVSEELENENSEESIENPEE